MSDEAHSEWRERMARLLAELHGDEVLSEQQCARFMGLDLVSWRELQHRVCASGMDWSEPLGDEPLQSITADGNVHCPNCPDQGWYAIETGGCGPDGENDTRQMEQVQCEFCYLTPNSVFNASQPKLVENDVRHFAEAAGQSAFKECRATKLQYKISAAIQAAVTSVLNDPTATNVGSTK